MRRFSCDEARAHLSDALAGEVGRPEANVLEAHLIECDPCRSLSELFLWQDRVIAELAAEARLDKLMSRVRDGLEHLDQVSFEDERRFSFPAIPWRWVGAAAVFLLALGAVLFWRPTPPADNLTKGPAPLPRVDSTQSPQPDPQQTQVPPTPPEAPPAPPEPQAPPSNNAVVQDPVKAPTPQVPVPARDPVVVKENATTPPKSPEPPRNPGKEFVEPAKAVAIEARPKTLDEAVRTGLAFIRAKSIAVARESKTEELVLWTYLMGGVSESDGEFQALLNSILTKKLEKTYNVALSAMVLEELDRVKYQKRIAQCAQFLLDNQCANGQWSYGDPLIFAEDLVLPPLPAKFKGVRKVPLTRKRDGPAAGDNSNTMYALLGLRACHDAGILLPQASVELAARWFRDTQTRSAGPKSTAITPEGWCYSRHEHRPYGSMTAGGVGSLVICDYILGRDWKKDREVLCGVEWLAKNFSVAYNPGPYEHANFQENSLHNYYYYMYALERAGILFGTEQIGGHYWYAKGLTQLVEAQRPDGGWRSPAAGNEVQDSCFAILFLRKATRALVEVQTLPGGKK